MKLVDLLNETLSNQRVSIEDAYGIIESTPQVVLKVFNAIELSKNIRSISACGNVLKVVTE